MTRQLGVSLVEILAVIILTLIFAILIAPSYITYITDRRLASAALALSEQVNLARITAIERNQSITLSFTTGSNWCFGIALGTNTCNCSPLSNTCTLGSFNNTQFPDVSTLAITSGFAANYTTFNPIRGSVNAIGKVTFTNSAGKTIDVTINKIGITHICSTDVGGYASSC